MPPLDIAAPEKCTDSSLLLICSWCSGQQVAVEPAFAFKTSFGICDDCLNQKLSILKSKPIKVSHHHEGSRVAS